MLTTNVSPETHASRILSTHGIEMFDDPRSRPHVVTELVLKGRIPAGESTEPFASEAAQIVGNFMLNLVIISFAQNNGCQTKANDV